MIICELWLPILVSGVAVFVVSSILHMLVPLHKGDMKGLPGEDAVLDVMRAQGVAPGQYVFPYCDSMKAMGEPAMKAKYERGPSGFLTVMPPGPMRMGRSLLIWFLYTLLVGVLVAYAGTIALGRGAPYMTVFRLTSTIAIAAYAIGVINDTMWKGQRWGVTLKFVFDGLIYALVTAGVFASMWPAA
jgi:hypothetical protein